MQNSSTQCEQANNKWTVLSVVILGSFMAILDNNIVNVALPKIMANFGATVDQIEWVVTGYMIAFAISMPATNWLQQNFGLKKVFLASLVIFCFGSALCGMAWDKDSIIFFRVIQALGGGALMPVGLALVSEVFPPQERGMAMGIWSIGAMVAPAIGPFLGGYLVDEVNWRSIFYINLPVGAVTILAAVLILSQGTCGPSRKFDWLGFSSISLFLAALLIALAQGQREGWDSDYILSCFGLSILGFSIFIVSNLFVEHPIYDLRIFSNLTFVMANIINFVRSVGIFGSMFLIPLFLQNLLNYTAWRTGVILAPTAISVAIFSPFSGIIADRIGARIPLFSGIVLLIISLYMYKDLSLNSDYWFLFWPQVIRGAGLGLINAPLMSAAINAVRRDQTVVASSFLTVIMQIGGAFGVALLGAVLQRREFFHYAHYLQQINNVLTPAVYKAQLDIQDLLLKNGVSPAELAAKGKMLMGMWVQKQAAVSAFGDAFVLAAMLTSLGVIPTLLIRKIQMAKHSRQPNFAE